MPIPFKNDRDATQVNKSFDCIIKKRVSVHDLLKDQKMQAEETMMNHNFLFNINTGQ